MESKTGEPAISVLPTNHDTAGTARSGRGLLAPGDAPITLCWLLTWPVVIGRRTPI
jgi:hypothetical protein